MIKVFNDSQIKKDQAAALDFKSGITMSVSVVDNGVSLTVVYEINAATMARITALEAAIVSHDARLTAGGL